MAVTTEEILAAARELAGRAMTDGEEKILSVLCAGELGAWRGRLREGVTEEQIRRFHADQEAFSAMMNYSPEIAYGLPEAQDAPRKE